MTRESLFLLILTILVSTYGRTQTSLELLGLEGKEITSMEMWEEVIVVGTNGDGVFYQVLDNLPDSGWVHIGLEGKHVTAVYPHDTGPGPVSWGVAAGVLPPEDDSIYVYCSVMGGEFTPNTLGISDTLTEQVFSLAGFPDPSICGEKYAATGGALYRQMWGDSLWVPVYEKKGGEGSGVTHVKTREDARGIVLAGGSEGITGILLLESSDFGDTWEYLAPPGPALAFDFDVNLEGDLQTVFVVHGDEISRSLNGGETWEIVFDEEMNPGFSIRDIHFYSLTGVLLAGGIKIAMIESQAVLMASSDLGESWDILYLQDMGPIVSVSLAPDGYAYFAIPQSGVFRVSLEDLSVVPDYVPESFVLHQPYPNPFNPSTTLEFSLPQAGLVTLTVYDLLGGEVETIVNQRMRAGNHTVRWKAGNIPSGIYFVTMESDGFLEARKVTVLR
ncbi:MAG: T9SS type A sorting domain-containing protein [Fidelibacterota bacterium]